MHIIKCHGAGERRYEPTTWFPPPRLRVSAVGQPASRGGFAGKTFFAKRSQILPVFIEDLEKNEPKTNPNKSRFEHNSNQYSTL
jgi:hypothetical protein